MNLIEALRDEANKAREFIARLDKMARLMGKGNTADSDPGLAMSKAVTQARIDRIERVIASGDTLAMVKVAAAEGVGQEGDDG